VELDLAGEWHGVYSVHQALGDARSPRFRFRNASVSVIGRKTLAPDELRASAGARSEPVPLLHP
jgi:hypothetical protein